MCDELRAILEPLGFVIVEESTGYRITDALGFSKLFDLEDAYFLFVGMQAPLEAK